MRVESDELITSLEANILSLLKQRDDLQQKVSLLAQENSRLRDEMMRTHAELVNLRQEHNRLRMAHAMVADTTERELAKRQLTRMIHTVDKAIENLKAFE